MLCLGTWSRPESSLPPCCPSGATVLVKKLQLCQPEIVVVGRKCTYKGQEPDEGMVEKVLKWPECQNISEVRGFLGMAGTVQNWI